MTEPDVTLTDYAITLECLVFCVLGARWSTTDVGMRRLWIAFFASVGAGAFFGGTVHGFFPSAESTGHKVFWPSTMLALGCTSAVMWVIGARLRLSDAAVRWVRGFAIAQLAVYALIVLAVDQRFVVAIATYLPATVFLMVMLILAYRDERSAGIAHGITGLALTFVAAAVQQLEFAVHPVYFNHNALYHVIQGIALFLLVLSAKWIVTTAHTPLAARSTT